MAGMFTGRENRMVATMEEHQQQVVPHRGLWFHVFVTNPDTGRHAYMGPYNTEDEAKEHAISAVGIEGDYKIFRSVHRDSQVAKQEFRHSNVNETGKLWEALKPIRNIRKR